MAEYITKEQALETQCEKCPVYNCILRCNTYNAVKNLPNANVVERSKIDKTIEELERYSTSFKYANRHDLADAVDYCIEIIQRNTGEDKDND